MKIAREGMPYILIAVALGLYFYILSSIVTYRVGDGGEYYALYFAWIDTFRPWMSAQSFSAYHDFVEHSGILHQVPSEALAQAWPELRVGETADFNHFWFYSFLAFIVSAPLHILGLSPSAHSSFLVLHFTLLLALFFVLYRLYGWRGLAVAVIMTFLSPMLWYLNKVHTELFTYVFSLLAVALIFKHHYLAGSLFLAVASTQNPSFAIVAFIPFFYRLVILRYKQFTSNEVVFAIGTALLVIIHPVYYFFRYGVPTPQLFAGGVSLGGNIGDFYIWLFDPDLGLFPSWPVGVYLVVIGLAFSRWGGDGIVKLFQRKHLFLIFFVIFFFLINFYAHSSTINLNSGASRGPARYALWYLPILFPLLVFSVSVVYRRKRLLPMTILAVVLGGWYNFSLSNPKEDESYSSPSYLSSFIQTYLSAAYSPPHEVFAERYSTYGDQINSLNPRAILGPDCRKLLVFPGEERSLVASPAKCFKDITVLRNIAESIASDRPSSQPFYFWLTEEQSINSSMHINSGRYVLGSEGNGNFILSEGWTNFEGFGAWAGGRRARLTLPCTENNFYFSRELFSLKMLIHPFGNQGITVRHGGVVAFQGKVSTDRTLSIDLHPRGCEKSTIDVDIQIEKPRRPLERDQSGEFRRQGISLLEFELQ